MVEVGGRGGASGGRGRLRLRALKGFVSHIQHALLPLDEVRRIYRLPPLPPTSQKVGWGRLLEALADLGCSLVAFCGIWDALGSAGQPK